MALNLYLFFAMPIINAAESIVDGCRDAVTPLPGSVVYCDLLFGYAEHSGIYLGNGEIAHLNSSGLIEIVDKEEFIEGTTAVSILVSSRGTKAVGNPKVAERARTLVGRRWDYNVIWENCHQFSSTCLTGDLNNSHSFLWMLKQVTQETLSSNTWREWR